ncbi:TPA: hypothetical protein ACH3X1_010260 [Trebouxia sp. C0004]
MSHNQHEAQCGMQRNLAENENSSDSRKGQEVMSRVTRSSKQKARLVVCATVVLLARIKASNKKLDLQLKYLFGDSYHWHEAAQQGQPQRLEWEARDWVDSSILEVTALFEKHNHGSHVDSREKQQLTNAGRDVTKEWSHDQCIGKAAVLIMRQLTSFSAQSLVLAYGLQKADHFSMVHEAVIKKQVKECIAASSESGVQLADLFAAFLDKQPELMELAEKEHTQLRKEKAEQTKTAEHRELMNKLVTRTEPQQQPQQSNRAYVSGRPPRGSVGGCR